MPNTKGFTFIGSPEPQHLDLLYYILICHTITLCIDGAQACCRLVGNTQRQNANNKGA